MSTNALPAQKDKPLFTPGPLTTSGTVKQAMMRDLGSRDGEFISIVRGIRESLLTIAGVSVQAGYEAVLMQGSGTFCIESVLSSVIASDGKLLVISNGAYGERIGKISEAHGIPTIIHRSKENETPNPNHIEELLGQDSTITDVAIVHCETTSGIMNPIREVGEIVKKHGCTYFVDSMSAFGAVEFDMIDSQVDYLVSSANKCIEGVPGFAFAICRRTSLEQSEGRARTVSLDLHAQWKGLESNGQFRFTPPTHAILAFQQALKELEQEGGVEGRARRYRENYNCLVSGMRELGFEEYVAQELQGYIITSFRYPDRDEFDFDAFYEALNDRGYVIYPGKVSDADCFRIGNIGHLNKGHVEGLLAAIRDVIAE